MIHTTEVTLEVITQTCVHSYYEVTFGVEFEVNGKYLPATLTEPEEYSELTINSLWIVQIDSKYLHGAKRPYLEELADSFRKESVRWFELTEEEFDNVIHEHCWDVAIDLKQANDAEACDYDNLKEGWD